MTMNRRTTAEQASRSLGNGLTRRSFIGVAALALSLLGLGVTPAQAEQASCSPPANWVGTWSTSMMPAQSILNPDILLNVENQTLRQIAHVSIGGNQVRVRISNAFGTTPLTIDTARIAIQDSASSIVPHTDRALTFAHRPSVVIPPGQEVLSDAVAFEVAKFSNLAISMHVPQATVPTTWHEMAQQTTYISPAGDFTRARVMPIETTGTSYYWLSGVEVRAPQRDFAVVTFGDSITDGMGSTIDANHRWPDYLSQRLNANRGPHGRVGVLNQGISGDRIQYDLVGPSALSRFDGDALDQPGVKYIVTMIGINDFGLAAAFGIPDQVESAADVIAGLDELALRAHARGLPIYAGTLTPCEGTFPGYFTPENEAKRQSVNEWIRSGGSFDAVIDFDAVLRDPSRQTQLLPVYDSGDHLHPSDAGYEAMANAVDLRLFAR